MIVDADFVWWFLMMILNDGFGWWFWMMILDDDFGWWFLIMVFQKSIIPGRGPILAIFRFWFCFFSRTGFFFAFFWKNASEIFAFGKAALPSPSPPRYSTIIRRNDHPPNWDSVHFPMFPHACLKKKKTRRCLKPTFFHQTSLGATWYVLQIHTKSCVILYEFEIHARWHPRRFGGKTWVSNSNAFFSFQACMWEHRKMHGISIWRVVHFDVRLLNI